MRNRLKFREGRKDTCICVFIVLLCVYILSPIFRIAVYNKPGADDYDYGLIAYQALKNGGGLFVLLNAAWEMMTSAYVNFSGLYTSNFINAMHPGVWGEEYYWLSTWIIFAVMLFFTFWSVFILNKQFVKRSLLFVVTASLVIVTTLVLWMPSAWEALYWFNGAMNYMPFAFMNVFNQCLLLEADDCLHRRKGKILLALSVVLSFLISGGNHVTSFANILMLLFVACYRATKKKFHVFLPLLVACVGFVIMYLAPGTQWRQGYFSDEIGSVGVVETIIATLRHWIYVVDDWVSVSWMLSIVMITPIAMEIANKNKDRFSKHFPIGLILVAGAILSGMFCVPYKAMAWFGAGRVTNVIWVTFVVLSWFVYVMIWGWLAANEYVNMPRIFDQKHKELVGALVICACLFALFRCHDETMSVSMEAKQELANGTAAAYAQEMDERIAAYKDPSMKEVAVLPIQNPSKLLFGGDIEEDPDKWPNNAMGEWYGGKKIWLIPQTTELE